MFWGTEATLLWIRMAYAYTGKYKIAKFEGHYPGGYGQVLPSINPFLKTGGPAKIPKATLESKGVHPDKLKNTILVPSTI